MISKLRFEITLPISNMLPLDYSLSILSGL